MEKSSCVIWRGAKSRKGYGVLRIAGGNQYAHRVSFLLNVGPIPRGKLVCHKCDNPSCINPQHLFIGSARDNTRDMISKNRWSRRRGVSVQDTVSYKSTEYESHRAAAIALKCNQATVSLAVQRGNLVGNRYKITNTQTPKS